MVQKIRHSYPALPITQNDQRFFFTTIPVEDLFPYCFVSRRNEDAEKGFQRSLNETRALDIAEYLKKGEGSIPTNIVLSAQDVADFKYDARSKVVAYAREQSAFLVLDGQHRLWGYHLCSKKFGVSHRVPVSIYMGLTRTEEARLFIDINTKQVGVPAALLLDIKQIAEIESSGEQILRGLFDKLNKDPKSPIAGQLSPARSASGKISRVTFNKSLLPVIRSSSWQATSPDARYQLLLNFVVAVVKILGEDGGLVLRAAFFEAVFDAFDEIIQTTLAMHSNAKQTSIQDVVRPLSTVDFSGALAGKSRATKAAFSELIKGALRKSRNISDDMV